MVMQISPSPDDVFTFRSATLIASSGSSEAVTIGPYDSMLLSVNSTVIATRNLRFRAVNDTAYVTFSITQSFNTVPIRFNGMSSATSSLLDIWGLKY